MPLSFRSRHRRERRKHRLLTTSIIALVFLSAALYLYGGRLNVSIHLKNGRAYYQEGNLDQALAEFNKVLELSPNHPQAIDGIGLVYVSQGNLVRAEIKYEQAIKLGLRPTRRLSHAKIGQQFLSRGIYAPAELEFRHALDLTPRDPASVLGHALSLHALGRLTEAIDAYRRSLELNPDLKLAQTKLTQARQELDQGFVHYIFDRNGRTLARLSIRGKTHRRYYALGQYAAHVVGYLSEEHGKAGLEGALESYLPGNTVTLTLDSNWQLAADRALGWRKGALVAVQPRTGEILAAVNHPAFNPNTVDEDWRRITRNKNQPLQNRAFNGLFTPGSIFKLVTAAAALETHLDMSRIFPVNCTGAARYAERTFWCWRRHNQVGSLETALDTSCNLAMAEVGFALGPDRLYEFSNKFGFGAPLTDAFQSSLVDVSLPYATSLAPMSSDDRFSLAQRSCGLGDDISISPLHAALLAAVVANDGRMMAPYFIKEIRNIRGEPIGQGVPTVLRTPFSPETAKELKAFMVDTVKHGIGHKATVPGITVAGKTGTTGDSRQGLNGWFVCFAPAENPEVAVAVYTEREGTGMDMAAPIARLFLENVLKKTE